MLVGSSVGRPESSYTHVPFKATKFFLVAEIMTLIFHNNTDEGNALVDMPLQMLRILPQWLPTRAGEDTAYKF